jgi:hypothetical protein
MAAGEGGDDMSEDKIRKLLKESPFSFLGTVERVGAATTGEVPIDKRTAVVEVDQVLHAPEAFSQLAGTRITVQLAADAKEGQQYTFFANGLSYGTGLAVSEIGRVTAAQTMPQLARAEAAGGAPFADLQAEIDAEKLRDHAAEATAVVVGRVTKLEKVGPPTMSEHDKDLWRATIEVQQTEKGRLRPGTDIEVLYANSLDVQWHQVPKPKAGQEALFLLHAPARAERSFGKYEIQHPEDLQPAQHLEVLAATGGQRR